MVNCAVIRLANAAALENVIQKLNLATYVIHVMVGFMSSKQRIKKERILRGIKTATAKDGLKITGRLQNSLCLHLDLTLIL